jgi:hypothetical protein
MPEKCQKPTGNGQVCDVKATYSFVLEGLEGLEDGTTTRRCTSHMALNIARVELTNLELATIQKI